VDDPPAGEAVIGGLAGGFLEHKICRDNLSIASMDFEELANAVDEDGEFRGFPRY
jgi:hypothetical protein